MSSGRHFFPKADASVLSRKLAPPPDYPKSVGPVYDCKNVDTPVLPWDSTQGDACYPPQKENYAPAIIPKSGLCLSDRYLRASLARNERLRLSMLWYYTCDIFKETEFLSGLQEKVCIAQESAAWEYAIIGILDVNFYTRLATIGVPLVSQAPGTKWLARLSAVACSCQSTTSSNILICIRHATDFAIEL